MQLNFVDLAMGFTSSTSFYRGENSSALRGFLEVLDERTVVLNPNIGTHAFDNLGINYRPLRVLNIENLYVSSSSAHQIPTQISPLMERLHKACTPQQMYEALTDGMELGLICFTEKVVPESILVGFDTDLKRLVAQNCTDFRILSQRLDLQDPNGFQFRLGIFDLIIKRNLEVELSIITTHSKGKKWSTAKVRLPWNSPYLVAKFNQLFAANWFYKYRPQRIHPLAPHQITYVWGFYQGDNPAMLKLAHIDMADRSLPIDLAGINQNSIGKAEDYKDHFDAADYLNQQEVCLKALLKSTATNPALVCIRPEIHWDLGFIGGQRESFRKRSPR